MMNNTASSGTTNTKENSVAQVLFTKGLDDLMLFSPQDGGLYWIPAKGGEAKAFLQEADTMAALSYNLLQSKTDLLTLEETLAEKGTLVTKTNPSTSKDQLIRAQDQYDEALAALDKTVGKAYMSTSTPGTGLMELIPLAISKDGKVQAWSRKWTYVRSEKMRNHWRKYKGDELKSKSFVKNGKLDAKELVKQFKKIEPVFKAEMDLLKVEGVLSQNLQSWADVLNVKATPGAPVQFSSEVHVFRYFAGCQALGEWNPKAGKIGGKLVGQTEFNVAQGKAMIAGYCPSDDGWVWALPSVTGKQAHAIGALRLAGSLTLEAAAGASAAAQLGLEIDYSALNGKPKIKGGSQRKKGQVADGKPLDLSQTSNGIEAGAEAFAGAKASGELMGALEYKSTEDQAAFAAMCKIGPKVEAQFGAGAGASLYIVYENGKIRAKAKAALCLGLGAKGELGLEVDVKQIGTFMLCLATALRDVNYEMLEIVKPEAFEAISQLQVMLVAGVSVVGKAIEDSYESIDNTWDRFNEKLDKENSRIQLMNAVLSNPETLRHCTPEAQGILLYQLTRHGGLTKADPRNTGFSTELLGKRKEAVLTVCRWAQSERHFQLMVRSISLPLGRGKGGYQANFDGLIRFLEAAHDLNNYDQQLRDMALRLTSVTPPHGYGFLQNDSAAFALALQQGDTAQYLALLDGHTDLSAMA